MRPVGASEPVLGVLAATRSELNAFVGEAEAGLSVPEIAGARHYRYGEVEAIGVVTGQGAQRCSVAVARALESRSFAAFLMVGVAGGTQPGQAPGDLLVASGAGPLFADPTPAAPDLATCIASELEAAETSVHIGPLAAVDRLAGPGEKGRLGEAGFVGVDMETHALLAGARRAGVPAAGLRVVLDPLDRGIPRSVAALAAAQGGRLWPDILGLARWPVEVRAIVRFMRDMGTALGALRAVGKVTVQAVREAS
ncbi:MAG: hypothetical protein OXR64_03305 [Chloroflexota bacterium]|nr:hypothetical protein [Chloroflexota bacterium]MDE2918851.1 hypothetical protein [Chloroflexota bacterium]